MNNFFSLIGILLSLSFLSLSVDARADVPADEVDVFLLLSEEADKAIEEEDYATAAKRINEALDVDPHNPSRVLLLTNLGTIYNYLDEDSLALLAFDEALKIAPVMTTALENRGRLHLKMGHKLEAYEDFAKVIALDSCNYNARYYHGLMALDGGDAGVAERDFAVIESLAPESTTTCIAMGALYMSTHREGMAAQYYHKLVERDPSLENFASLIECFIRNNDLSQAAAAVSKAIELYPREAELYYCRAWINKQRYLIKEAKEDAAKAVELGLDPMKASALFKKKK